jgi:transposase
MKDIVQLLDDNLVYIDHQVVNDSIKIFAGSKRTEVPCPFCEKVSARIHSTYERSFQDLPIQGKKVTIIINNRKYFCDNPECSHRTFAETFGCLKPRAKRSNRLEAEIMKVSLEVSSVTASRFLCDGVAQVSKSTVCNILKKTIRALDKASIENICIDDFALKKRRRYGTIMIDMDARRVVDILESRETEDVADWLATYPNIRLVSRDGSQQYASAIRKAHPCAVQVSDRFHLIKNLTDATKQHIMKIIPANCCIPATRADRPAISGYWAHAECHGADFPARKHSRVAERKRAVVENVRTLASQGIAIAEIARQAGVCAATARKYFDASFNPEDKRYGTTVPCKLTPYKGTIDAMLRERRKFKDIEEAIRKDGYSGGASAIRMYATRQRRILKAANADKLAAMELVERKWMIKLLYQPLEKIKGITAEQVEAIVKEHPVIGDLYAIVRSFKEMTFSNRVQEMDSWIEAATRLGIDEINSFVNGISEDLDAVKNSIMYRYNNGLAEGFVNKLKVVKRIMYGRCSFTLLRHKLVRNLI